MSQNIYVYIEFYVVDWLKKKKKKKKIMWLTGSHAWKVRMMIYGVLFVT